MALLLLPLRLLHLVEDIQARIVERVCSAPIDFGVWDLVVPSHVVNAEGGDR